MPMTHIPGLETETDSVSSKTSTLQDIVSPSAMPNTQRDILQIIRKEEDHAMSLLAANPLLSNLFLTYANRAATLEEEVVSLRAQLNDRTDRARTAEDRVEDLRARPSVVEGANCNPDTAGSSERAGLEAINSKYAERKKEAENTIAELGKVDEGSIPKASKEATKETEKATKPAKGTGPKRPLSAYMFFSQDWRERIKAENPDAGFGEIGKLLGTKWKGMGDEEKKSYVDRAAADKIRAERHR